MATTRIMSLHTGKGRTVGKAIRDIIDYVENPDKTDGGRLISSYQCDSRIADAEFLFATMVTPPQKKGGDRPMRRPTPKLQWEGTGLTRHCLSYSRSFWQTVSQPSHCGVRFAQVEKRTTTHTRVTKQAEWQWAAAGAG